MDISERDSDMKKWGFSLQLGHGSPEGPGGSGHERSQHAEEKKKETRTFVPLFMYSSVLL